MALLPDLATAALYAAVVFLVSLGFLVVFVETVRPVRVIVALVVCALAALGLLWFVETGLAFLMVALAGAVVANQVFEWLTTRR